MKAFRFDSQGLIPAIAQDRLTGEVRMVAWMNEQAVAATAQSGLATFYSRSQGTLWQKGETSGNILRVHAMVAGCEADALLLLVDPVGPSCHTGRANCFFELADESESVPVLPYLLELERVIAERATEGSAATSYTRSLLEAGPPKIASKLREEASELSVAVESETDDRVANEAADVFYHLMVALRARGLPLRRVIEVLAERAGISGHEEKAGRAGVLSGGS